MKRAVFLDRDGVVNELVYYREHGIVDSPFNAEQFRLLPGVGESVRLLREADFAVVLVSNQPGIAKEHLSLAAFEEIKERMRSELEMDGAHLDAEYYCLHHPEASAEEFRTVCECRKPDPGLLLRAASDMNLDLTRSWMIGDGLTDVAAGKKAGTRTILLSRMKCELCHLMEEQNARPDGVARDLVEATRTILDQGEQP